MNPDFTLQEVKSNLTSQFSKVMHDIATAYQLGSLDDPNQAVLFCSLLALVCEGRVQGVMDEETMVVKWSLTPEYASELEVLRQAVYNNAQSAPNVVKGPWA